MATLTCSLGAVAGSGMVWTDPFMRVSVKAKPAYYWPSLLNSIILPPPCLTVDMVFFWWFKASPSHLKHIVAKYNLVLPDHRVFLQKVILDKKQLSFNVQRPEQCLHGSLAADVDARHALPQTLTPVFQQLHLHNHHWSFDWLTVYLRPSRFSHTFRGPMINSQFNQT